ncbi:hypothetical protein RJ641_004466, partial [Dillenia turbinata]
SQEGAAVEMKRQTPNLSEKSDDKPGISPSPSPSQPTSTPSITPPSRPRALPSASNSKSKSPSPRSNGDGGTASSSSNSTSTTTISPCSSFSSPYCRPSRKTLLIPKPKPKPKPKPGPASVDDPAVLGTSPSQPTTKHAVRYGSSCPRPRPRPRPRLRTGPTPTADQFARSSPRRGLPLLPESTSRAGGHPHAAADLQSKLDGNEIVIRNLRSEISALKAELCLAHSLNSELQSLNMKLSDDLASALSKLSPHSLHNHLEEPVTEYQSPKFKDIQKLIANKLQQPPGRVKEKITSDSTTVPAAKSTIPKASYVQNNGPSSLPPPPPPPPSLARLPSKANTPLVLNSAAVMQPGEGKFPQRAVNLKQNTSLISVHSSIVGEIQNRSAHLMAIKADIETKGEFINGLIESVLAASCTDIEDVVKFVDWLDRELSSLADERAVLKHFKWPEKKADAMREAAIEYRDLKLLESEISSYEDGTTIPCRAALKKMAGLLDKSDRSIQRLVRLRNSVILSYKDHKIPTDWMQDSGIISKIKKCSVKLAKVYMERVTRELQLAQNLDKEFAQEALMLQGVQFAYRAHQVKLEAEAKFAGGLDSETLCAFEEFRQHVPGNHVTTRELLTGIP